MKAPRLTQDADGHLDLLLENGKFAWAEDGTQAAQHATVRLMVFRGELSLNGALTERTLLGTRWYEVIFNMAVSRTEKEYEIKRRLLGVPEIEKIITFEWSQTGHTVTIDAEVLTSWGDVTISQEITPL